MASNIVIRGVTYADTPEIDVPKTPSGTAKFYDVSDASLDSGAKLRNGVSAYGGNGTKYTGSMTEKAAQTYTPTTSDQQIAADQYLAGAQTIKGDENLLPQNIKAGVSLFNIQGTLDAAVIAQDSTTHVLSIS